MNHTIQEHFHDNLIASTQLDHEIVSNLDSAAVGPISLSPTLTQIASSISVNIKDSGDASYARPSVLAHLSAFTQNCAAAITAIDADAGSGSHAKYNALPRNVKTAFTEWEGMVAAIALSGVYSVSGLELSVLTVKLHPDDPLHHAILKEMAKDDSLKAAVTLDDKKEPLGGTLFFVCHRGEAFAAFHPEYGVFPMTSYNGSVFTDCIPWYKGGWKSVVDWSSGAVSLDAFCMNRILWWCRSFGMNTYANALESAMKTAKMTVAAPAPALILGNSLGAQAAMDAIWPWKGTAFCAVAAAYMEGGLPARIPNIFLDKLLIQYTAGDANNCTVFVDVDKVNRHIYFDNDPLPDFLSDYAPVLPFNENLLPLLDSIVDIRFTAANVNDRLESVRVMITFRNGFGENFSCIKDYAAAQMQQTALPYMMMWPYLDMPDETSWKSYYATWANSARVLPDNLKDTVGASIAFLDFRGFNFDVGVSRYELNRFTDNEKWSLCQSATPFRYAFLCGGPDSEYAGLLIFPRCPVGAAFTDPDSPIVLGVDFGTTSTVCALQNGALTTPLPYKDYSVCVTCMDSDKKAFVDRQHWLGETPPYGDAHSEKIFSIVQLFSRNNRPDIMRTQEAASQQYYLDGRMFLLGGFLIDFVTFADVDDALSVQKITNDMKFSSKDDPENTHAASLFLAALYTYAVLHLLEQRFIPKLEVRASYPNDVTKNALVYNWTNAKSILDTMMDPAFTGGLDDVHYCREATAASEYYKSKQSDGAYANVLLSLDIGGGTTDMSITSLDSGTPRALSVRYAGREIMVDSLIEYYRRWYGPKGSEYAAKAFRALWNYQDPDQQYVVDNFTALPAGIITPEILQRRLDNKTVRIDTEYLLNKGLRLGVVAAKPTTNFIRELITLKFLVIVKLASRFIGNHLDMWGISAEDGEAALNKLNFELQVSGTSAQLLQYIFDSDSLVHLSTIDSADFNHSTALMDIFRRVLADALSEKLPFGHEQIMEKLNIRLYVDSNVAKKQEVCEGLLKWDREKTADPVAAAANTKAMSDETRRQRENEVKTSFRNVESDSFRDFICNEQVGLLPLMRAYESAYTSAYIADVGLKDIHHVSELLQGFNYVTQFNYCRNVAAEKWSRYIVEYEQEDYRDMLMQAYVLNECLNRDLASIQAQQG